jgi:hypothetical protein
MQPSHPDYLSILPGRNVVVDGVTLYDGVDYPKGTRHFEAFRTLGLEGYRKWAEDEWDARTPGGRIGFSPPGHLLPERPPVSNYR